MDAHHIQTDKKDKKYCINCGTEEFQDGCKFSKIVVENKRIEVENKKVIVGAVLGSLGYLIFFVFVAVVYLGLDGVKMQISRMVDECRKGGWFAAISHLVRRR